jgi:hypothetical protein
MKKWSEFRVKRQDAILNYIQAKSQFLRMSQFMKIFKINKILEEIFVRFETRKRVLARKKKI